MSRYTLAMSRRLPEIDDDLLARRRGRRRVRLPDLLVAAVTVLHHDAGLDLIAEVTGQSTKRVVRRSTDV